MRFQTFLLQACLWIYATAFQKPMNSRFSWVRTSHSRITNDAPSSTALPMHITDVSTLLAVFPTSPEPIHSAFAVTTFLPQPLWLLIILFPNNRITKTLWGGLEIPLICSLIHLFIVMSSIVTGGSEATAPLSEFNNVFDPSGDPQQAFEGMVSKYPNFVAEEWSHVLTWDVFAGRYIWLDGVRRTFSPHTRSY